MWYRRSFFEGLYFIASLFIEQQKHKTIQNALNFIIFLILFLNQSNGVISQCELEYIKKSIT